MTKTLSTEFVLAQVCSNNHWHTQSGTTKNLGSLHAGPWTAYKN